MTMPRALRALAKDRESGWTFTLLLCIPYLAFLIWMHAHHEMWRDEVHAWNLARLAQGFWELVTGERMYEGHPPLWFWYLHVWSWFIQSAWGIQAATITAATAAAVVLARFAPFPRYLKVLLLFTYYFGYEYTVMSRNYVLGWLLVCGFCALYHPIRVRHFALGIALALLSLTSIYGLLMSIFLLLFIVLDQTRISPWWRTDSSTPGVLSIQVSSRMFATLAIVVSAGVFCVLTLEPPDPNPFSPAFNFSTLAPDTMLQVYDRFTSAFLPWARMETAFWWMPFEFAQGPAAYLIPVSLALLIGIVAALYPSWRIIVVFLAMGIAMEVFHTVRFSGGIRHRGHFLIFFVAACWLLRTTFPRRRHWISAAFLLLIIPFQLRSLVIAAVVDTQETFSGGRETAAFVREHGLQDLPIVGGPDYQVSTVAGYLMRPFVAAETEEINADVVFHSRRRPFSGDELMTKAVRIARERKTPVVIISFNPVPNPPPGFELKNLFRSRPGTIGDENFLVYTLRAQ